jgi:LPXTG-motif cell wall-anchored protein
VSAIYSLTTAAASTGPTLAATGSDTLPAAIMGASLLALGTLLLVAVRNRRTVVASA